MEGKRGGGPGVGGGGGGGTVRARWRDGMAPDWRAKYRIGMEGKVRIGNGDEGSGKVGREVWWSGESVGRESGNAKQKIEHHERRV